MQTEEKQMTFNEFKIAARNYEMKRAVEIVLLVCIQCYVCDTV